MPSSAPHAIRWLLACVAALAAACLAVLTILLSWFNGSVGSEDSFVTSADFVVHQEQFRSDLTDHATDDIMDSEQVKHYLGDGSDGGIFSGVKSWARGQAKGLVHATVEGAVESDDFSSVWKQMASQTHSANLSDSAPNTLVIDAGPLYQTVNDKVKGAVHVDLGLDSESHILSLEDKPHDGSEAPIAGVLHRAQSLSQATPAFGAAAVMLALLAALAAPRGKALVVALSAAITGLATWITMTVLEARFSGGLDSISGTAGLIAQHLGDAITANVQTWALTSLGVGIGIAVLLVIVQVLLGTRRQQNAQTF